MASLRDIKKRIQSIENIAKITKAMKMVSAAKLKKSQSRMVQCMLYLNKTKEIIGRLVLTMKKSVLHGYDVFKHRKIVNQINLISITSNRGLCGSFNNNILKKVKNLFMKCKQSCDNVSVTNIGKKGYKFLVSHTNTDVENVETQNNDTLDLAKSMSNNIYNNYIHKKIDTFYIVHGSSKSSITQEVRVDKIFPINDNIKTSDLEYKDYIYEPSNSGLIEYLIQEYLTMNLYKTFLESEVSEHSARMQAMENATKNSQDVSSLLTLQYNRARQANITRELVEIISGAEALK